MASSIKDKIETLTQKINDAFAHPNAKYWRDDLEIVLDGAEYSEGQIEEIKKNATASVFNVQTSLGQSLSEELTHCFEDPISKSKFNLTNLNHGDVPNNEALLQAVVEMQHVLGDIVHNYGGKLIPAEDIPGNVRFLLESLSDISEQSQDVLEDLLQETGINPDNIKPSKGIEHIAKLPEDFLGLE